MRIALTLLGLLSYNSLLLAQGTQADYDRANGLQARFQNKVYKATLQPHWLPDKSSFWYRNDLAKGAREYVFVDCSTGKRAPAFEHTKLAGALSKALKKEVKPTHLSLQSLKPSEDRKQLQFECEGKAWQVDLQSYELSEVSTKPAQPPEQEQREKQAAPDRRREPGASPDGKWVVSLREANVFLREKANGTETQLTKDGTPDDSYAGEIRWSPDAKKFVVLKVKKGGDRRVTVVESSPKDQVEPKVHSWHYLKPGDPIPQAKPHLFHADTKKEIPVSDELFPTPWYFSEGLRWQPDSKRFTFLYNQRGHQVLRLLAVSAETGKVQALIEEKSATFIDYAHKLFTHYLDETKEILWLSERDGWNHLYLYDAQAGQVKKQITQGPWVVRKIDRVDAKAKQIWFQASGIYPEQDPYYLHFCRVNFDGTGLVYLTASDGTHTIEYSPDDKWLIAKHSRVDLPPVHELRSAETGKRLCELERADAKELLASGWLAPERFQAKARDGKTDIYGILCRPTNFDPKKRYPVIEQIYAGPQGSFTPKAFSPYFSMQKLAELGFVVVQCDGLGTSHRSKAFHDVCWKNLGDSGFPDRILWLQSAAKKYPYLDLSRVGIYGGSAGGQSSTRALLAHGDFYKVAVSDCGCHDNRVDKIWWNELWMGWPIGPHYADQSNVTQAHKLQGKLLLMVGELDRNVDPASTMQVVNALVKANKDFDLIVFPGGGHGAGGSPYGERRRQDYFVRHLLQVEPRAK